MSISKGGLISFSFSWWCNRLCSNFRTRQCAFIVTTQPPSPPTSSSRSSSLRKERRHCWCPPGCENLVTASPFHQQDPSALITSASRPLRSYHLILFLNTNIIYIKILIITIHHHQPLQGAWRLTGAAWLPSSTPTNSILSRFPSRFYLFVLIFFLAKFQSM